MDHKRILVVEDDEDTGDLLDTTLTLDGYTVFRTTDAIRGFQLALLHRPDLVIIDLDIPRLDGLMLSRQLRKDIELAQVPIIMLTGQHTHPEDRIAGLRLGADDYIQKPFIPQELSIRASRLIVRTEEHSSLSPLTRLPGNNALEKEIVKRIEDRQLFALCYFDLDNFKVFNDHYGYQQGDRVIKLLASIINDALSRAGTKNDFLAHIGGDDFLLVTVPEKIKPLCDYVIAEFARLIPEYYNDAERRQGTLSFTDRKGERHTVPLMSLSVAVASNENHEIKYYAQLLDILTEMKRFAKTQPGSIWVKDRRLNAVVRG